MILKLMKKTLEAWMTNDNFEVPIVNFGKSDDTVIYNPLAGDFKINIPHEYYHTINNTHNLHSEYVSIPKNEYLELLECQKWKRAMESAGIDNWRGYSEGISILEDIKKV